jgi:NitT/TauT family transport system substrate-binding protein
MKTVAFECQGGPRRVLRSLAALLVWCAALTPASAQDQLRIGMGYGLAFLPLYICEDLKLIEKHGKDAHIDVKASYPRFVGAADVREALDGGNIDVAPFGTVPLLVAWDKTRQTDREILAISGITTLPLTLLTKQSNIKSFDDLKSSDRIAVPALSSPQTYLLEMKMEKLFTRYDRVKDQLEVLSHADAMEALSGGTGQIAAYFSSPPYTQLALRDADVHAILSSSDVMNGKFSFLMLGAPKSYIDAQPQISGVVEKAVEEAARIIRDDPRRAAQIYLTHEPSSAISGAAMETVIRAIKDEFGSAIYGVQTTADFLGRHGELKTVPHSWKDVVAPALLNSPGS